MTKHIFFPIAIVIIFIVAVGFFTKKYQPANNAFSKVTQQVSKQITIGGKQISVEIADTDAKRQKGLGGRESLADDRGMLFIFDQKDTTPSFWMKDMKFALDIIWINDDKIVKIDKNIPNPPSGTADNQLKLYRPQNPIDYVLEVNTGFSDKNNVKVGDSVEL
jgi:uncharacterized membrane protein (UPF0127 family)